MLKVDGLELMLVIGVYVLIIAVFAVLIYLDQRDIYNGNVTLRLNPKMAPPKKPKGQKRQKKS